MTAATASWGEDGAMHRSRLCAALVDVPAEVYETSIAFWGGALGKPDAAPHGEDPDYASIGQPLERFGFMVQRVGAPARVHLDIETDDIDAEVARLTALGATEVERVQTWVVMRDPAGLLFCVVGPQFGEIGDDAKVWP
jgi:predicted enzyme related to lactoylglutathione lyase